eukprot:GHVN01039597.1.p1 GENE.GHVN01039597.1~~GHVN01039597.1.p1  ORF type:complete len:181 (+),score=18.33 GHVN01039597.1:222-764(+)
MSLPSTPKTVGDAVPSVIWATRVRPEGREFYEWKLIKSDDLFKNKRVALFALPGAFTPTCSSTHLPGYERHYEELRMRGIDEVICLTVNDAFVCNAWAKDLRIRKVRVIPDGNAEFTSGMGLLVDKSNLGFGRRSWRYSMIVDNGIIEDIFIEANKRDRADSDPFKVSCVKNMIKKLDGR